MKKVIVILAMLAGASVVHAAEDSYLVWMVNSDAAFGGGAHAPATPGTYYAKVIGFADGAYDYDKRSEANYLTLYVPGTDISGDVAGVKIGAGPSTPAYYASLADIGTESGAGAYTFFVELYNDSTAATPFARSEGISYSQASSLGYVASMSFTTGVPANPWAVSSFVAVPEPNSALLLLLGCAALALRRRKEKAA